EARTEARESPAARKPLLPRTPRTPIDANASDRAAKGLSPEEKARLADTGVTRAPFTTWVAEDLGDSARPTPARPAREAEPDPADAGPSNGDAAREAFRALLNMPAAPRREPEPAPLDVLPKSDFTPESELSKRDVPDTMSVPLQQRVLEYS